LWVSTLHPQIVVRARIAVVTAAYLGLISARPFSNQYGILEREVPPARGKPVIPALFELLSDGNRYSTATIKLIFCEEIGGPRLQRLSYT
jgi:hypothetical protein